MAGKFIVLSDIHLNLWAYGNPEARLDDQICAIHEALTYAVDEQVDAVLWTGDIFHTQGQVQTPVLQKLYGALASYGLASKTVFLPGNHDMVYRDDSHVHALDFLSKFGRVPHVDRGTWSPISIPHMPPIWPRPYTDDPADLTSWLDVFSSRDGDLLLMHQGVRGVEFQSKGFVLDEGLAADMIPPGVFHAFVGHCHSLRRVSANMTVPGALQQHNFGDAGDPRGFLIVDYTDTSLSFRQIAAGATKFLNIPYVEDTQALKAEVDGREAWDDNEFIRITDVPISRVDEVRALTQRGSSHTDIKITTRPEQHVPVQVQQHEIGDLEALIRRFAVENNLQPELLAVGHEILRGTGDGVS